MTDIEDGDQAAESPAELLAAIGEAARESTGPDPLIAGTFVIYPRADGGLVLVTNIEAGRMVQALGEHRMNVSPAVVRTLMTVAGGGPLAKLRNRMTRARG